MNPTRLAAVIGSTWALVLTVDVASAANVGVAPFTGVKTKTIQARIIQVLERQGHSAVVLDRAPEPGPESVRESAREAGVSAIVGGDTVMKKNGWTVQLTVRDATEGEVVAEPVIRSGWLPGLLKAIDKEGPGALGPPIDQAEQLERAAAEAEAERALEAKRKEAEAQREASRGDPMADDADRKEEPRPRDAGERPPALSLLAGGRAFRRDFSYHQDVNQNLRPYRLDAAPAAFAAVGWYPGAHLTSGPLSGIGIIGELEHSFAASSGREDGTGSYTTQMRSFMGGLRYRHRLGDHELGVSGQVGRHDFEIQGDEDPTARSATGAPIDRDLLPDVAYTFIRPGLDARFGFGSFGVGLTLGYRVVQSTGDLGTDAWFPDATATAMDAGVFFSYALGSDLRALFGLDYRRYGVDMRSRPEDVTAGRDVAGGALDQYLAGWAGIGWEI
jgi:hypothetical protein